MHVQGQLEDRIKSDILAQCNALRDAALRQRESFQEKIRILSTKY